MSTAETKEPKRRVPYARLGNSGLKVSRIILGMMSYGSSDWQSWVLDEEEAMKHIKAAYDAGIQTFDTADVYSNGLSEVILGKAIKKFNLPRDEIVVMTKAYHVILKDLHESGLPVVPARSDPDGFGYVNQYGLSRKHIFDSVKKSLERLQLDYVDVFFCHKFDYNTPIEETMQALHDVVKAGYVRYIGMSSCWAWQFHAMQNYAITHNLTPFITMENHYNLTYREDERELIPTLKHFGVGAICWSPLARGLLTRPFNSQSSSTRTESDPWFQTPYGKSSGAIIERVEELAKKRNVSMAQIATAWILAKDAVVAPIVGTTRLENLYDIIEGAHLKLTEDEMKYLEEPYVPMKVIGHV